MDDHIPADAPKSAAGVNVSGSSMPAPLPRRPTDKLDCRIHARYYISHSPLPTFFAGSASEQFYSKVDAAAGSGISWYNMQVSRSIYLHRVSLRLVV